MLILPLFPIIIKLLLLLIRPLSVVTTFLDELNRALLTLSPQARLTFRQKAGLATILVGIIMTEVLNWDAFERRSLGKNKASSLRWIFKSAKISWHLLLQASVKNIFSHYELTHGSLMFDDTDKQRTKTTVKIPNAHKVKDKATGGYFNGQELVFMVLVTDKVTFPIDFRFYVPDPVLSLWRKNDKKLKIKGIKAKERPKAPQPNHAEYPRKQDLALSMLKAFVGAFPDFNIKGVLADALYGTGHFMDSASAITGGAQIVSQLRANQCIASKNSKTSLARYFSRQSGVKSKLMIRGGKEQEVTMLAARLHVKAHGKRRFVVALKYENETEYRYLVATHLSWRHDDIARLYTLRWLIEVFIQDWKTHCGWNKLSKQQGNEGSERGLILSLLCDHLLLFHPEQSSRLKNKQPGMPVGCLIERLKVESLIETIEEVVNSDDQHKAQKELSEALISCLPNRKSSKHMAERPLGRQEESETLKYHAMAA